MAYNMAYNNIYIYISYQSLSSPWLAIDWVKDPGQRNEKSNQSIADICYIVVIIDVGFFRSSSVAIATTFGHPKH